MSTQPIKRSRALMPLSREHHFDLLLAWKIRKGLNNGTSHARIAEYIGYMNDHLMESHFKDEEELLFAPLLPGDALCERAMEEHAMIRSLIEKICTRGMEEDRLFLDLADTLDAHVRFEERELFPYLEEALTRTRLHELEQVIGEAHGDFVDEWGDPFWDKKPVTN